MDLQYEEGRIYAENDNGELVAEITYSVSGGIANIDHTFVDASLRGQGMASKLVKAAADQIQKEGKQITASCWYAAGWLKDHPEYTIVKS